MMAVSKVQELKAKMVEASHMEDFLAADELKKQWEVYYTATEEQIKLCRLCESFVKVATSEIQGHVTKMSYDKAGKWKELRNTT